MLKGNICKQYLIKSTSDINTYIEGYASVFNVADHHNDIVIKGAFNSSLQKSIKLLWQHDALKPIGVINKLYEDEYGLKIEAEINNNILSGREASELIKQKAIDGLSIGFAIKGSEYNQSGQRLIADIDLFEVSIVTFPANREAQIYHVKNKSIRINKINISLNRLEHLSKILVNNFKESDQ